MLLHKKQKNPLIPYVMIAGGTLLYALGLNLFVIPHEWVEGGITGIALLLNYVFQIPISISTITLNFPLFFLAWKTWGLRKLWLTSYGTICLIVALRFLEWLISQGWLSPQADVSSSLWSVGAAGICSGIGLGLVFRYGATTGGSDIVASLLHSYTGWRIGRILFVFDFLILSISLLFVSFDRMLISLLVLFISSRLIDFLSHATLSAEITSPPHEMK